MTRHSLRTRLGRISCLCGRLGKTASGPQISILKPGNRALSLYRLELRQAQDILVGIVEPGDAGSAGCCPDAIWACVVDSGIALEDYTGSCELLDGALDRFHFPAKHGVWRWIVFAYRGHPQHGAVGIEDQSEGLLVLD